MVSTAMSKCMSHNVNNKNIRNVIAPSCTLIYGGMEDNDVKNKYKLTLLFSDLNWG